MFHVRNPYSYKILDYFEKIFLSVQDYDCVSEDSLDAIAIKEANERQIIFPYTFHQELLCMHLCQFDASTVQGCKPR